MIIGSITARVLAFCTTDFAFCVYQQDSEKAKYSQYPTESQQPGFPDIGGRNENSKTKLSGSTSTAFFPSFHVDIHPCIPQSAHRTSPSLLNWSTAILIEALGSPNSHTRSTQLDLDHTVKPYQLALPRSHTPQRSLLSPAKTSCRRLPAMCHIENIHFSCGHLEDTKYTMCDQAMTEMNHVTNTTQTMKNYPCADCFGRGVEAKAKQVRDAKGRK